MKLSKTVKKRIIAILFVILLILAVVTYTNLKIKTEVNMVNVVYTAKDIPPRTKITENMLQVRQVPNRSIPPNAYFKKQDVLGKWTVTDYGISANSFLYKNKVVNESELPDASNRVLKPGQVSFPLLVDIESSLGNSIMPNSYVDLYFKGQIGNGAAAAQQQQKPVYGMLVSHVRVVSVKDSDGTNVFDAQNNSSKNPLATNTNNNKKYPLPKIYIFAVDQNANTLLNQAKILGQVVPVASGQSYSDGTNDKDSVQKNDVVGWIRSQSFK